MHAPGSQKKSFRKKSFDDQFQTLITNLSTAFVKLNDDRFEDITQQALQEAGQLFGADRSYIFRFTPDHEFMSNTHEWCAPGISAEILENQNFPTALQPWSLGKLFRGASLHIPDVQALPPEAHREKEIFQAQSIQSLICVPICNDHGVSIGFMGLDKVRSRYQWSEHEIRLLQLMAEIIGNALARMEARRALAESERLLRETQEIGNVGSWSYDLSTETLIWSEQTYRIYGQDPQQFTPAFAAVIALHAPDEQALIRKAYTTSVQQGVALRLEHRIITPQGHTRYLLEQGRVTHSANGAPLKLAGSVVDITHRVEVERRQRAVMESLQAGIVAAEVATGKFLFVNDFFCQMLGYSRDELLQLTPVDLHPPQELERVQTEFARMTETPYGRVDDIPVVCKDGSLFWAEIRSSHVVLEGQACAVAIFTDVTDQRKYRKQLEYVAHYDPLTQLPNRMLLADRLQQAMQQTLRRSLQLAVVYIDLDAFKTINDQHGHAIGDRLLRAVAQRMQASLRVGDTLARLGGDEFVAVLIDQASIETCIPTLQRLLEAIAVPVVEDGHRLLLTASMGVTLFPQAQDIDADQLLRQADQAMYQAKLAGKNQYYFFDAAYEQGLQQRQAEVQRVVQALNHQEMVLYYQPKVNMRSGQIMGFEALIRWQHPGRGLLPPGAFLPLIEEHAVAVAMGHWVLDTALQQMTVWQAMGLDLPVSVNIGAQELMAPDFVARLQGHLATHPEVPPRQLELEILETSALKEIDEVARVLHHCVALGVGFALDDFGTGYSSLTYLRRLPVQTLKIDQSFVRDMLEDPEDLAILEGVLGLASAFRRVPVAEGVETIEHGELLLDLCCEVGQGYGIARPMPAAAVPGWVRQWRPDSRWYQRPNRHPSDLPVLFAGVEHRAWVRAIDAAIAHAQDCPELDVQSCRLGMWLTNVGQTRRAQDSRLQAIHRLHEQIHTHARTILECQQAGRASCVQHHLQALHHVRDALLEQLEQYSLVA